MPSTTSIQPSNPFIRQLASSDRKERDRALSSLRTYLQRSKTFSETDFLKLWKGLFYCMWMSDKPRTQQRLARDLAELVDVLKTDTNILGFLDAFWKTMAREWGNIDALRMDKYLYLVRCYVSKGFEHAGRKEWANEEFIEKYLGVLKATPFDARDHRIPNGVRYHTIDIYVDELDKMDTKRSAPLETLLKPMRQLAIDTPTKAVKKRIAEALDDDRVKDWQGLGIKEDEEEGSEEVSGEEDGEVEGEDDDFGGFDD